MSTQRRTGWGKGGGEGGEKNEFGNSLVVLTLFII